MQNFPYHFQIKREIAKQIFKDNENKPPKTIKIVPAPPVELCISPVWRSIITEDENFDDEFMYYFTKRALKKEILDWLTLSIGDENEQWTIEIDQSIKKFSQVLLDQIDSNSCECKISFKKEEDLIMFMMVWL